MSPINEGSIIAGKYQLERPLARGGMGSVWVAKHLQLEMRVAVKFMDAAFASTADGWNRFSREAKAVAQIQSPNVIQVHDYGVEGGIPYIAMELLDGEDLGARLKRCVRLPVPVAAPIITQMCRALRKAHDAGIVHRDLKPANVFLSRNDDEEIVKILDFGIAKMTATPTIGEGTATGVVLGSAHYMSPEQVRGIQSLDYRSDLWSLGVIAFRTVTGRLPFAGEQMGDVLVGICSDPIPTASSIAPDLGPDVDAFFVRALTRNPAERFQSARDLAAAFAVLGTSSPARLPPSAPVFGVPMMSSDPMTPGPMRAPAPSFPDSGAPFPSASGPFPGPPGMSPPAPQQMRAPVMPGSGPIAVPGSGPIAVPGSGPIPIPPVASAPAFAPPVPAVTAPQAAWQGTGGGTLTSAAQSTDLAPSVAIKPSSGARGVVIAGAVLGTLAIVGIGLVVGLRKPAPQASADAAPAITGVAPAKQEPRVEPAAAPSPTTSAAAPPESTATAAPPVPAPTQSAAVPPAVTAAQAPPKASGNAAAPPGKKPAETPKKADGPKKNEELGF